MFCQNTLWLAWLVLPSPVMVVVVVDVLSMHSGSYLLDAAKFIELLQQSMTIDQTYNM